MEKMWWLWTNDESSKDILDDVPEMWSDHGFGIFIAFIIVLSVILISAIM